MHYKEIEGFSWLKTLNKEYQGFAISLEMLREAQRRIALFETVTGVCVGFNGLFVSVVANNAYL